jgi:hypothetical protein
LFNGVKQGGMNMPTKGLCIKAVLLPLILALSLLDCGKMGTESPTGPQSLGKTSLITLAPPEIQIKKFIKIDGVLDDADTPPGPMIPAGAAVEWVYEVTNPEGSGVILVNVTVTDSDPGVVVSCEPMTALFPGVTKTCGATGTAVDGQYWNEATVTAHVIGNPSLVASDSDVSYYHNDGGEPPGDGIEIPLDIKPTSCPNPLNTNSKGVLPVAILGTEDFDVTQIDPASVRLEGVAPLRWASEDVATPFEPYTGKGDCLADCTTDGPDGFLDLTLKFETQAVVAALGGVNDGDCIVIGLTGNLKEEFGGTPIVGEDVVVIRSKKSK